MKVLILTDWSFEGGADIRGVIIVPDTFDAAVDERAFYATIPQMPLYSGWLCKDGKTLNQRYRNKARELWEANLRLRFGNVPFEMSEHEL